MYYVYKSFFQYNYSFEKSSSRSSVCCCIKHFLTIMFTCCSCTNNISTTITFLAINYGSICTLFFSVVILPIRCIYLRLKCILLHTTIYKTIGISILNLCSAVCLLLMLDTCNCLMLLLHLLLLLLLMLLTISW